MESHIAILERAVDCVFHKKRLSCLLCASIEEVYLNGEPWEVFGMTDASWPQLWSLMSEPPKFVVRVYKAKRPVRQDK